MTNTYQPRYPGHLIYTTGGDLARQNMFCAMLSQRIVVDFPSVCMLQHNRSSEHMTRDLLVNSLDAGRVIICPAMEKSLLGTPVVKAATAYVDFDLADSIAGTPADANHLHSLIEKIHQTLLTQEITA